MPANDFPGIRVDPASPYDSIRRLYLLQEPDLLACIRRGDRKAATKSINILLVHIYSAGQAHSGYLKGLLLELVVMMSRAAVEEGAPQTEILGLRYQRLTELAAIDDDEALAGWLREVVSSIFDAVDARRSPVLPDSVGKVLQLLRENPGASWTPSGAARKAGISPSRMGELLKQATGRSFGTLLRESRIEHACELLTRTDQPLAEIADACGFCDQSYFTNVFQSIKKTTPSNYRSAHRRTAHLSRPG